MVKDHSDSEKGNPLPPHMLLFPISSKGSFICMCIFQMYHIHKGLNAAGQLDKYSTAVDRGERD